MDVAQITDAFVAKYNGVFIDEDAHYGSQCWDLVARYAREGYGCPRFPTVSGGAEGLYRIFADPIPQFFIKVPASELRKGDIAVTTASFYPPYGHTFLVWERIGNTLLAFEQDGSKDKDRDGDADGVAYIVERQINNKIAGGLRPIGGDEMPTEAEVKNYLKVYTGIDATDKDIKFYTARPWSKLGMAIMDNMLKRIQPQPQVVADVFTKHLKTPATGKQITYYSSRPWQVLFDDITDAIKRQPSPGTPLTRESVLEYVQKNLK